MKKLLTIVAMFMFVFATSCSKDDHVTGPPDSVVGHWVLEKIQELNSKENIPYAEFVEFTLKSDRTFTGISNDFEIDGDDVVTKQVAISGTYKISAKGDKITIMEKGEDPEEFDIYSLTSKKMVLRGAFEDFNVEITFNKN